MREEQNFLPKSSVASIILYQTNEPEVIEDIKTLNIHRMESKKLKLSNSIIKSILIFNRGVRNESFKLKGEKLLLHQSLRGT